VFFQRKKGPASQPARGRANRRGPYRTLPREAGELSVLFSGPEIQPVQAELVDLSTRGIGVRIPGRRRAELVVGDLYQVTIGSQVHPDIATPVQLRASTEEGEDAWRYGFEFIDVGGLYEQLDDFFVRYLNRRHDERLRLAGRERIQLTLDWEGGRREVHVFDVSSGGVGFSLSAQDLPALEPGARVAVSFRLPGAATELVGHATLARLTLLGSSFVLGLAFDFEEPEGLALGRPELERYLAERKRLRDAWNSLADRSA
jgi:hypothetical protein